MTEWRYEIKYGPEGEANYAWIYKGGDMIATMKTHHAVEIVKALAASPAGVVKPKLMEAEEYRRVMDAAIAAYEANTPPTYRYSATALCKAVEAAFAARIMSAIEPAGVGVETMLKAVMEAIVSCGHEIDHDAVVLKFSERQKGHNAYNQLNTRVRNAIAASLKGDEQ